MVNQVQQRSRDRTGATDYFLKCNEPPSGQVLDVDKLPAKTDAVQGVEWLPRLIPKAKAKLRGELRHRSCIAAAVTGVSSARTIFYRRIPILVWRNLQDDQAIIHWVMARIGRRR